VKPNVQSLLLSAIATSSTCTEGTKITRPYQSGWAQTGGAKTMKGTVKPPAVTFTYGHVEVRFRTPAGRGLWPAIWLLSPGTNQTYPVRPEIDILEQHGDTPGVWRFHVHFNVNGSDINQGLDVNGPDTTTGFHTVGLDWSPGLLRFWIDGAAAWTYNGAGVPDVAMYMILDLAVGGDAGTPDPNAFPANFLVDWVHITT
jgi:beta-glucanase (GH16 family)